MVLDSGRSAEQTGERNIPAETWEFFFFHDRKPKSSASPDAESWKINSHLLRVAQRAPIAPNCCP